MTSKTTYTHQELTHRSTTQLIALYNRLFNTNIWDEMFNPYEYRQEIILALWAEMRAQEIVAQFTDADRSAEKYQAMKIVVSADGMAIIWNTGAFKVSNRKVTNEQMSLIRQLRADGETMEWISQALNIGKKIVFNVLSGGYALTPNRWNTNPETPDQIKPRRQSTQTFKAAIQKVNHYTNIIDTRPSNAFWQGFGL